MNRNAEPQRAEPQPGLHRLLVEWSFYPLLSCAALACAFWTTRVALKESLGYGMLVKNLVLAWIPYLLALSAVMLHRSPTRRPWTTATIWSAWLVMFPNAPYIFTDLVHWRYRREMPWWFDLGMVLMFGLAGFFAGIVSLRIMHDIVRKTIGSVGGWTFAIVVAILSGFGIYLGRFERWNSWDLLTRPHDILAQIAGGLMDPLAHTRPIGVTLMFGTMVLAGYVMFVSMTPRSVPLSDR